MATLINGAQVAADIKREVSQEIIQFEANHGMKPGLAVILVGENPASKVYVSSKAKSMRRSRDTLRDH